LLLRQFVQRASQKAYASSSFALRRVLEVMQGG
jgi:hypothetical protein